LDLHEYLLNNTAVAVVSIDRDYRIQWMNLSAESMFSCSRRVAVQQRFDQIFSLPVELLDQISDALQSGQILVSRKLKIPTRYRETLFVDCIVTPLDTAEYGPALLIELMDIDRQHKIATEQALLEQQERSHNILRGVAHEVLNPLGGIRGAAQLLESELSDSRLTEYTQLLITEADRLQSLLQRMLGPNTRPVPQYTNIHEILNYVERLLLQENPGNVRTVLDYDPSIPDIYGDREKLIQVFINLVSNALHALKNTPQPSVIVKTRVERNFTIRGEVKKLVGKIQIIDNGPGIPTELKDNLFDPLVSGRQGGTGLGLSIAQSLTVQHGGLIECHRKNDHTVFAVTLPVNELTNEK